MTTTATTPCPKCGTVNTAGARFCFKCGAVMAVSASTPTQIPSSSSTPGQPALVTLQCPTCGAKLQLGPEIDRFACMHCGNEHIVRRGSGYISIEPVLQELRQVNTNLGQVQAADNAIAQHVAGTSQAVLAAQENANRMAKRAMTIQQVSMLEKQLDEKKQMLKKMYDKSPLYGWTIFITCGFLAPIFYFILRGADETVALIMAILIGCASFGALVYAVIRSAEGSSKKENVERTKQEIAWLESQLTTLRAQLNQ